MPMLRKPFRGLNKSMPLFKTTKDKAISNLLNASVIGISSRTHTPTKPNIDEACKPRESASFEIFSPLSGESDSAFFDTISSNEERKNSKVNNRKLTMKLDDDESDYQSSASLFDSVSQETPKKLPVEVEKAKKRRLFKNPSKNVEINFKSPDFLSQERQKNSPANKSIISFEKPKTSKPKKKQSVVSNITEDGVTEDLTEELFKSQEGKDAYKQYLSQTERPLSPIPDDISIEEQLKWLHRRRRVGLYVCCDTCDKYRYLENVFDPLELPDFWYCHMNKDPKRNKCSDPEESIPMSIESSIIINKYNAGSIVWAKMPGYPWWPAMVEDDPDCLVYYWLKEFSDEPTWYHVTFFDADPVTRAWIKPNNLKGFQRNINSKLIQPTKIQQKIYGKRLEVAKNQARDAVTLDLLDRLNKYSFLYRYDKSLDKTIKRVARGKKKSKIDRILDVENKPKKKKTGGEVKPIRDRKKKVKSDENKEKQNKSKFSLENFVDGNGRTRNLSDDESICSFDIVSAFDNLPFDVNEFL